MIRSQSFLLGLIAVAVVLSGCQSDRQRYQIGDHENVQVPEGFFPEMAIERSWASGKVIYNLGLSQITHLGGYHGSYAEEPSQQVQTGSSD